MMSVMIAWRNRSAHMGADINIDAQHKVVLEQEKLSIASEFRGLCVDMLLEGFEKREPSFKEVASLIHATQKLVEEVECLQFSGLDKENYLREVILAVTSGDKENAKADDLSRRKRIQSVWGRDDRERVDAVCRFFRNIGFSEHKKYPAAAVFDEELIRTVSEMTPKRVFNWLSSGAA